MANSKVRRNRTSKYIYCALQLYTSGLSLRKTSERPSALIGRNHASVWIWILRYKPKKLFQFDRTKSEFIIDETLIKGGSNFVWVAIEPKEKMILGIRISIERSMLITEQFMQSLIKKYVKHNVSTDGGTWYPQACKFLYVEHPIHSSMEKSLIERHLSTQLTVKMSKIQTNLETMRTRDFTVGPNIAATRTDC